MTQAEALNILKTGANVFLTGEPGAGKTHTVNEYVRYLKSCGVEPSITASTGIAATHIGGMTIHSWAGIGIKRYLSKYDLDKIGTNERIVKRIERARVLIIDEVSMLGPETLEMVDAVCRTVRRSHESFGGLSVLLVGDFFQLPPVQNLREVVSEDKRKEDEEGDVVQLFENSSSKKPRFAYQSGAWQRANFITCYLTEQHRQDDETFLSILSAIRRNEFDEEHMTHIQMRKVGAGGKSKEGGSLADIPHLYSHNIDVDRVNTGKLGQIKSDEKLFTMTAVGPPHMKESLMRSCLSPERLVLKVGAAVMCTKNNQQERYVNGTQGTVTGFEKTSGNPIIKTRAGRIIVIEPTEWSIEENGKVKASISQIPLRLSWAITVHKSQGMSMDAALMDLSSVFEHGQGYVALSRVRRLEGLHLLGWNKRAFEVHPEVLEQDGHFRANSQEAENSFAKLDKSELEKMHQSFIKACGGSNHLVTRPPKMRVRRANNKISGEKSYDLGKIREKYPNAYQPWGSDEDGQLINMFKSGVSSKEIAGKLGRQGGSIRSRLRKHGLIM